MEAYYKYGVLGKPLIFLLFCLNLVCLFVPFQYKYMANKTIFNMEL